MARAFCGDCIAAWSARCGCREARCSGQACTKVRVRWPRCGAGGGSISCSGCVLDAAVHPLPYTHACLFMWAGQRFLSAVLLARFPKSPCYPCCWLLAWCRVRFRLAMCGTYVADPMPWASLRVATAYVSVTAHVEHCEYVKIGERRNVWICALPVPEPAQHRNAADAPAAPNNACPPDCGLHESCMHDARTWPFTAMQLMPSSHSPARAPRPRCTHHDNRNIQTRCTALLHPAGYALRVIRAWQCMLSV